MFEFFLIGGGILLIIIAIIFLLPGLGVGLVIPVLGDVIDVPLAFVFGLVGLIMITIGLILGGIGYFLSQFWWLIPLALATWVVVVWILGYAKKKLKR